MANPSNERTTHTKQTNEHDEHQTPSTFQPSHSPSSSAGSSSASSASAPSSASASSPSDSAPSHPQPPPSSTSATSTPSRLLKTKSSATLRRPHSIFNLASATLNITTPLNPILPAIPVPPTLLPPTPAPSSSSSSSSPSPYQQEQPRSIEIKILNKFNLNFRLARWPTKSKELHRSTIQSQAEGAQHRSRSSYSLSSYRGTCFDPNSIPSPDQILNQSIITIGTINQHDLIISHHHSQNQFKDNKKKGKKSSKDLANQKTRNGCNSGPSSKNDPSKPMIGWIYFDLIKPNGYVLHLQVYIKINPKNLAILDYSLGRFDLDSNRRKPMPSGVLGKIQVIDFRSSPKTSIMSMMMMMKMNKLKIKTGEDEQDQEQVEEEEEQVVVVVKEEQEQEDETRNQQLTQDSMTTMMILNLNKDDDKHKPNEILKQENIVDDSTLRPPLLMGIIPKKRLTIFSFVSHPKIILSLIASKDARYHEGQKSPDLNFVNASKFLRSDHLLTGVQNLTSGFFLHLHNSKFPLLHRSVSINPLSGLVTEGNKLEPLASTSETKSVIQEEGELNYSISYGFHDSRMGKRHSLYAYVTPNHSSWLQNLIHEKSSWLNVPFSRLVLQGSHDSGMFTNLHPGFVKMITKMKLDSDIGNFLIDHGISFVHILTKLLKTFSIDLELAICNIANTQKDNIFDQLRLGARFFDFRPGYCFHDCINGERGKIYHQHACVPGYEYVKALEETLTFLIYHPMEIVVFELKSDGFIARKTTWRKDSIPFHSMIPTRQALNGAIEEARKNLEVKNLKDEVNRIKIGGAHDLDRKIGDLLQLQIRLIIIYRMGTDPPESGWEWERDDSYDHTLYDTDRPEGILDALDLAHSRNSIPAKDEETSTLGGTPKKPLQGSIYQLQATPTKSIADDIVTSLTYSKASSLLVYTKSNLDPYTYNWIKGRHFIEPGLVVLLNDFVDSVLTEHAIEKSKIRAGLFDL